MRELYHKGHIIYHIKTLNTVIFYFSRNLHSFLCVKTSINMKQYVFFPRRLFFYFWVFPCHCLACFLNGHLPSGKMFADRQKFVHLSTPALLKKFLRRRASSCTDLS